MSIHVSSKVITLNHKLQLNDGTKNNINNPIRVANSIFVIAIKGLIISGTDDVIGANQQKAKFAVRFDTTL